MSSRRFHTDNPTAEPRKAHITFGFCRTGVRSARTARADVNASGKKAIRVVFIRSGKAFQPVAAVCDRRQCRKIVGGHRPPLQRTNSCQLFSWSLRLFARTRQSKPTARGRPSMKRLAFALGVFSV